MPSARSATPFAAALAAVAALALPAAASAASTGAAPTTAGPANTGAVTAPQPGQPTLFARPAALYGHRVELRGTLGARAAGRPVSVQRLDRKLGWVEVAHTTAGSKGGFTATWRANRTGRQTLRATVAAWPTAGAPARFSETTPDYGATTLVSVYRPALATWYGPENSSSLTACGLRMTHQTVGVAHKTLPCGTKVEIYYRGRTTVVPVIDRGPYANGADWDLTEATARELGFDGVETVGSIIVGR